MARIFEPVPERKRNNLITMSFMQALHVQESYMRSKRGIAVNDGKYITLIHDDEEEEAKE